MIADQAPVASFERTYDSLRSIKAAWRYAAARVTKQMRAIYEADPTVDAIEVVTRLTGRGFRC